MILHKKANLFDAQGKVILVHAVNCKGVMGSGIAKEFKQRFYTAFKLYEKDCQTKGRGLLGDAKIYPTQNPNVYMGCLFTSNGFGRDVDSPASILMHTQTAVDRLLFLYTQSPFGHDFKIYSNKFNSGLFNVPWAQSYKIVDEKVSKYSWVSWTVCDPSL